MNPPTPDPETSDATMDEYVDPVRSRNMARVRRKDTKPELAVRRLCHAMGYRFRLHRRDLPGTPDLVFPGRRKVIFVHGCFWHHHHDCKRATLPKTRREFWLKKFASNINRDERNLSELQQAGWQVLTVWECETRMGEPLREQLKNFIENH